MRSPRIAIVGRPNVGKSSLLNMLAGRRVAIVDPTAGVTRDRIATPVTLPPATRGQAPLPAIVIDTGGYGIEDSQYLTEHVERQIAHALAEADLVLFVIDAQTGIVPLDLEVASVLRSAGAGEAASPQRDAAAPPRASTHKGKPVLVVANKVDSEKHEAGAYEASALGFGDPAMISTTSRHRHHGFLSRVRELVDRYAPKAGDHGMDEEGNAEAPADVTGPLLAIIGKRNAGKSTLVNALAGDERVIVSEIEGTTRDSVDVRIAVDIPAPRAAYTADEEEDDEALYQALDGDPPPQWVLDDLTGNAYDEEAGFDREEPDEESLDGGEEGLDEDEEEGPPEAERAARRDSVQIPGRLPNGNQLFTLIDTAGLRRRKSVSGDIEYYSHHRSLRSVRRADVCLFLIDASVPISQVDRQLAQEVVKHGRPTVIVVNKWDLAEAIHTQEDYVEYLDDALKGLSFAPIVFVSALKLEGMREPLAIALNLYAQSHHRVGTGELNRVMKAILADRGPGAGSAGKPPRVYFVTQVAVDPPTVVMSVNDAELFNPSYQQFLLNRFRDELPFSEVPIRLLVRGKPKRQR